jgi:hypothetical protein
MDLSAIREMVQKLPQWISSVGRTGWQKIGAVAVGIFAAAGACIYFRKRFMAAPKLSLSTTTQPPFAIGAEVRFWEQKDPCGKVASVDMKATPPTCTITTQYGPKTYPLDKLTLYKPVPKETLQVGDQVQYLGTFLTGKTGEKGKILEKLGNTDFYVVRFSGNLDYPIDSKDLTRF